MQEDDSRPVVLQHVVGATIVGIGLGDEGEFDGLARGEVGRCALGYVATRALLAIENRFLGVGWIARGEEDGVLDVAPGPNRDHMRETGEIILDHGIGRDIACTPLRRVVE